MQPKQVAIIGGGITGLACTYFLQEASRARNLPLRCHLIEASHRFGGKLITEQADGFIFEGGADSFITTKPWGVSLCRRLRLPLTPTNPVEKAIYIVSNGRLVPLPIGMNLMIPSRVRPFLFSPLVSLAGKMRMGLDLFIPRPIRCATAAPQDESIGAFVRRRLGEEAVHQLAEPLLAGIYAGDVERLSIMATFPQFPELEQTHGSLIWGLLMQRWDRARKPKDEEMSLFVRPEGGVGHLAQALCDQLDPTWLRPESSVVGLKQRPGGYEVEMGDGAVIAADAVVATVHTHAVADWVAAWDIPLADLLRRIQYVSTASVSMGFRKEDVRRPLDGFGFVVPRREGQPILAATWSSTKFPNSAPAGYVLIRAFLGGAHQEHRVDQDDAAILADVRASLQSLLGITAKPVVHRIFRWYKAHPQYHVGHLSLVAEIKKSAALHPGFYLTGSPYHGVGIPDCIHQAEQTANKLIDYLFR